MSGRLGALQDSRLGSPNDPLVERRIGVLVVVITACFVIFVLRLFQLQVLEGAALLNRARRNSVQTQRLEAPRGDIVDREGRTIASTRPAYGVSILPSELRAPNLTYRVLGLLLGRSPEELSEAVGRRRGRERFQLAVLDADLDYEQLAQIEAHRHALRGVVTDIQPRRHYLEGDLAAHLLGTIGEIRPRQLENREFAGYRAGEIVGLRGIELRLQQHLRGRAGGRNRVVDVAGREIEVIDEVEPEPGGRVVLALDLDLQRAAVEAFDTPTRRRPRPDGEPEPPELAKMGALIALDPRNGDVLALVSRPAYDPNAFAGGVDPATWARLIGDKWRPLQDRALSGQYPPGSTYKAFVAAAGLAEGVITTEDEVFCPGFYRLGRRTYRCWKRGGHGKVKLVDALRESCDVYFYDLGRKLGVDRLARYAKAFGFGRRTGIGLPDEKSGLVPSREWKQRARGERWIGGETLSAAIGQGFNLATPLQMAVAFATIANGGYTVKPRLLLRLEDWRGTEIEEFPAVLGERVPVSDEDLVTIREALTQVVMAPHGTGGRARVRGVNVAGKTGTSQVVRLKFVEDLEGDEIPVRYRDHAWFAAFAPAEAPEIVVAVLVEHGGGGGSVAAPIAQRVLARYFEKRSAARQPGSDASLSSEEGQNVRGH